MEFEPELPNVVPSCFESRQSFAFLWISTERRLGYTAYAQDLEGMQNGRSRKRPPEKRRRLDGLQDGLAIRYP